MLYDITNNAIIFMQGWSIVNTVISLTEKSCISMGSSFRKPYVGALCANTKNVLGIPKIILENIQTQKPSHLTEKKFYIRLHFYRSRGTDDRM